jgi:signal transduction histidine kinase/CheY-like chemotaxis protein/HPt (histidine-containing phosphotransfer) domain-containing protein
MFKPGYLKLTGNIGAALMDGKQAKKNDSASSIASNKQPESKRPVFLDRRSSVFLLIMMGGWLLISFFAVSYFTNKRLASDLQRYSTELNQTVSAVTYHFDRSLSFLNVAPVTVADNMAVITALRSLDKQSLWERKTPEDKLTFLQSRQDLAALNLHLVSQKKDLDVDVIWILAASGDCIASSNYDRPESFVGISYSDRAYFKSAMAGQRGRQYAVGRQTNIPGLFFSAPIYDAGRVIGAVTVKIDISKLSRWFDRFNCFVTDTAGVIILSSNKLLEHYALENAPVFQMSAEVRDKQYKRSEFPVLKIGNLGKQFSSYPAITLPDSDTPHMLAKSTPTKDGYIIYTFAKISDAKLFNTVRWQLTSLLFISGAAVILLITGASRYMSDMRDAIAVAEAASLAKSMFLANMSHEIRTPMNGIIGMTELCLTTNIDSVQLSYLNGVKSSADNLLSIINDILDFSKIETGKIALDNVPFMLCATIGQALQSIAVRAAEKGLEVIFNHAPDTPDALIGDPGRLRQIIINLVGNAIKFTARGQVLVHVSLIEGNGDNCLLSFSIKDEGIGIPEEKLRLIFDPFEQADQSTTKLYGGTGLGLAISRTFIELMGGNIRVESEFGKGSTFTFTARFGIQHTQQPVLTAVDLQASGGTSRQSGLPVARHQILESRRRLSILIAEDVPINQLLIETILTRYGHAVTLVGNGEEAVQAWESDTARYDFIFMDIQMPVMDGFQATRRIRELENSLGGHIPIVAMTAYAMKEDRDKCREAGMDDYISKPFQPEDLLSVLKRLVEIDEKEHQANVQQTVSPENTPQPDTAETVASVFDRSELLERLGGREEMLGRFIDMFTKNVTGYLEALRQAIDSGVGEQIRVQAHTIKGASANISALKMMATASALESAARDGESDGWVELFKRLESEFGEFKGMTRQYCKDNTANLPGLDV